MPNARSKKKKLVGGYVNYKLKHAIKEIAIEESKTQTEVFEMLLNDGVARYKVSGSLTGQVPQQKPLP